MNELLENCTILVVEDNVSTLELIKYNLIDAGHRILTANSGAEALETLHKSKVHLVISDVMMPEMDGFTLRERLIDDPILSDIPFIFLTARVRSEDHIRGLNSGADDYITKPFDPAVLVARVKAVLARRENLEEKSRRDFLTGLLNRSALEQEIGKELDRLIRYKHKGSLVFLDIDNFKAINDTYGHAAGDLVLMRLSEILSIHSRTSDIVGRYGGEEFVLYLPDTEIRATEKMANYMLEKFSAIEFDGFDKRVTFSAGITQAPAHGVTFDLLCEKADQAMYMAKQQGKARVVLYTTINGVAL